MTDRVIHVELGGGAEEGRAAAGVADEHGVTATVGHPGGGADVRGIGGPGDGNAIELPLIGQRRRIGAGAGGWSRGIHAE